MEAGEESSQFESYVCEVILPLYQNILSRQRQHIDRELILQHVSVGFFSTNSMAIRVEYIVNCKKRALIVKKKKKK